MKVEGRGADAPAAAGPSTRRLVLSVAIGVALAVAAAMVAAILFLDLPTRDVPLMFDLLTASGLV